MCQRCSVPKLWHAKCYSEDVQEVQCQGGKRIDGENSGVDSHPSTNSTTPSLEVKISGSCDQSESAAKTSEDHPEDTKCQVLSPKSLIVRSPIGSIKPRLLFNIELNGIKLLALLDNRAGCSYLGKGLSAKFADKLELCRHPHTPLHSGLERRKSDINLGFTGISNKKLFYNIAFESLSNLL